MQTCPVRFTRGVRYLKVIGLFDFSSVTLFFSSLAILLLTITAQRIWTTTSRFFVPFYFSNNSTASSHKRTLYNKQRVLHSVDRYFVFVLTCNIQNEMHQCRPTAIQWCRSVLYKSVPKCPDSSAPVPKCPAPKCPGAEVSREPQCTTVHTRDSLIHQTQPN